MIAELFFFFSLQEALLQSITDGHADYLGVFSGRFTKVKAGMRIFLTPIILTSMIVFGFRLLFFSVFR